MELLNESQFSNLQQALTEKLSAPAPEAAPDTTPEAATPPPAEEASPASDHEKILIPKERLDEALRQRREDREEFGNVTRQLRAEIDELKKGMSARSEERAEDPNLDDELLTDEEKMLRAQTERLDRVEEQMRSNRIEKNKQQMSSELESAVGQHEIFKKIPDIKQQILDAVTREALEAKALKDAGKPYPKLRTITEWAQLHAEYWSDRAKAFVPEPVVAPSAAPVAEVPNRPSSAPSGVAPSDESSKPKTIDGVTEMLAERFKR